MMRRSLSLVGAALTVLGAVMEAHAVSHLEATAQLQGDGRTPAFYSWNGPVPAAPGKLLRSEPVELPLLIPGAARGLRILYSSTDGVGDKARTVVSGDLFFPAGEAPAGGWPLVAWAHGTVGLDDICAPSLQGRSFRDVTYLSHWLSAGYALVATDYQGLGTPGPHPYLNARPEAYSLLDAIRAVQGRFHELAQKVVIVGQSQGGHAAFAAATYKAAYAPELDLRGTVATGTPYISAPESLLGSDAQWQGGEDDTIYYRLYLLLMAQQTGPEIDLSTVLTPLGRQLFEQARAVCNTRLEFDTEGAQLTRANAFRPGALVRTLRALGPRFAYPTLKAGQPVFLGIGARDEEVPAAGQLQLAKLACAAGTTMEVHLYPEATHGQTVNLSLQDSLPFVRRVMAGEPVAGNCDALPPTNPPK